MEIGVKKSWLAMSEARLRKHLAVTLRLPPPIAAPLVEQTLRIKESQRAERIRKSMNDNLWGEFLGAPRAEAAVMRVIKNQLKAQGQVGTPRWAAACAYMDVISDTIERLKTEAKRRQTTPRKLPALLHADGFTLPRNNGEHWSDYVKNSDLQRIRTMFDSLPPPARGRHKAPFTRVLPPKIYKRKRLALAQEITSQIEGAERERAVAGREEDIQRLDTLLARLQEAQYRLDKHQRMNSPLPETWHGLLDK